MNPTAEVEAGRLEGLSNKAGRSGREVQAFLGVPYAADPVGPLRFRAPQPAEPWAGTRQATAFGPSPMQSASSPYSGVIPGNQVAATSEACLTLDVWVPDGGDGHRPVLVWVPGGAYLTGGTSIETYDGSGLAADGDVIVVGVNYRLGVLFVDQSVERALACSDRIYAMDNGRMALTGSSAEVLSSELVRIIVGPVTAPATA